MGRDFKHIEIIITRYLSQSASIKEIETLTRWLKEKSFNSKVFQDFVKINYSINRLMLDFETEKEKDKLFHAIGQNTLKPAFNRKWRGALKYAAIFIGIISFGIYFNYDEFNSSSSLESRRIQTTPIQPGSDKAILTIESGEQIVLGKDDNDKLIGRVYQSKKLVYQKHFLVKNDPIKHNYLTIPKGGQFMVQLSDSTKVWLNSESQIKYPVQFIAGETRRVELNYGEAYFEVSESSKNNGDKFIVTTGIQEIEVLGTEFNIKAYNDDDEIRTTLVEGKINVSNGSIQKVLKPSEQSILNLKNNKIIITETPRLFDKIAWKQGYFSFRKMKMKEIMKTLSRWYDVEYTFHDSKDENKSFTGVLDRENSIEQLLINIQKTNEIYFEINGRTITIK